MAKRPSKHLRPPRPLASTHAATVVKADGRWLVQTLAAGRSVKSYLCPGCQQAVPTGTPHVVVWPVQPSIGSSSPVDERRHWHQSCWNRRR